MLGKQQFQSEMYKKPIGKRKNEIKENCQLKLKPIQKHFLFPGFS